LFFVFFKKGKEKKEKLKLKERNEKKYVNDIVLFYSASAITDCFYCFF